jgi:hypothetical protein
MAVSKSGVTGTHLRARSGVLLSTFVGHVGTSESMGCSERRLTEQKQICYSG